MKNSNHLKLLCSITFVLMVSTSWGQNIIGKVVDKNKKPLEFASVAVINPIDSTLIRYTSVGKKGNFKLTNIKLGKSIFQINLIGFKVYQRVLDYKGKSIDFGIITLQEQATTLDEVVVKAIIPVSIKRDTIAFNTKAFKTRIDDSVEDLLKKLPGIEVDANGKVKAQGEDVTKVYVGGKEFFSGDPAIAIKNLSAKAIKKVEVIDEKTDKARVTGIKDSQTSKVINLTLKNEKKANDFGTFQGGYGSQNRFLTSLNYNRFTSKLQTSVIGRYNNVNSSGSDISQILSFGGSRGRFRVRKGGAGTGFVTTGVGGINLGYEFQKKQNFNADYFYNYTDNTSGNVFTKTTEFIGNDKIYTETKSTNRSTTKSNKVNFNYYDRANKLTSIRLRGNIGTSNTDGLNTNTFESYNTANIKDIENTGFSSSSSKNTSGRIDLRYIRKLHKKSKRNIGIRFRTDVNNTNSTNQNRNSKAYIDPTKNGELILGQQEQNSKNNSISASVWYDEPLSDKHYLNFYTGIYNTHAKEYTNQSETVNGSNNSSSTFIADIFEDRKSMDAGIMYKYTVKKITIDAGGYFQQINQDFGNKLSSTMGLFTRKYSTFNPSVRVRWRPKKGNLLYVRIRNGLTTPTLSQVSPIVNNFNPYYVVQGNQDLTPEEYTSFMTTYTAFNHTNGFNFYTSLFYSYADNAIINSETTDINTRIKTVSFINQGSKDNFNFRANVAKRLKNLGVRYTLGVSHNFSNYQSIINTIVTKTRSKNTGVTFGVENNNKDVLDVLIGGSISKNIVEFSGAPIHRDYVQQSYFIKSEWNVTNAFNINSQFKYDVFTDNNFGTNQSVPIWNASISYSFLKSKSLNVKLSGLDLLNKNVGYDRTGTTNSYQETIKDVLGSYYMLSLTYTLNSANKGKVKTRRRGDG